VPTLQRQDQPKQRDRDRTAHTGIVVAAQGEPDEALRDAIIARPRT
jgi:hypothetical protein